MYTYISGSISITRFTPDPNIFGTVRENPENSCFCNNKGEGCPKISGIFNMTSCQFGAPMMLSWPHFFQVEIVLIIILSCR